MCIEGDRLERYTNERMIGRLREMQLSVGGTLALTRLGTASRHVVFCSSIVNGLKALHSLDSEY